jgi:hypothetical protein
MDIDHATEVTLVLRGAFRENVTLRSVSTLDRAAGTGLKALSRGTLGFHLRHLPLPLLLYEPKAPSLREESFLALIHL